MIVVIDFWQLVRLKIKGVMFFTGIIKFISRKKLNLKKILTEVFKKVPEVRY